MPFSRSMMCDNPFLGLKNSLSKIKTNHGKTLQYQAMLRAFEAKDRSVMEHNYERVNFWSLVHLCAMVGTAMLQVTYQGTFRFGKLRVNGRS